MNDPVDLLLSATEDSIHNGTKQKDKEYALIDSGNFKTSNQ